MRLFAICAVFVLAGCSSVNEVLLKNARANTRDLKLIQSQVVLQLPEHMLDDWTDNLVAFVVGSQVMEAAIEGKPKPDQHALEAAEWARVKKERGE